jgi:non-ribosomal peptide synthetase component F
MQIRDRVNSDRTACVLLPSGIRLSFAELEARANRLVHTFRQAGLGAGDIDCVADQPGTPIAEGRGLVKKHSQRLVDR